MNRRAPMKKALYFSVLLIAVIVAFRLGSHSGRRAATAPAATVARPVLYYVDPMHPDYRSDKPGVAPDCGMQLEPVYAGSPLVTVGQSASSLPPGSVRIDPQRQQLFGVRVGPVEETSGSYKIRLLGRVAADEGKIYKL